VAGLTGARSLAQKFGAIFRRNLVADGAVGSHGIAFLLERALAARAYSTLPSNSRLRHSSRNRPLIPAVTVTQFMMGAAYDPWRDAPDLYGIGVRSREVRASISAKASRWFMAARNSQAASVRR